MWGGGGGGGGGGGLNWRCKAQICIWLLFCFGRDMHYAIFGAMFLKSLTLLCMEWARPFLITLLSL